MKRVDVVIPVCHPDDGLITIISRLKGQSIVPEKIFLINTKMGNDNAVMRELRSMEGVVLIDIEPSEFDHGGTRDMAMRLCTSEYVLMMTQDAVPKNQKLIENLLLAQGEQIAVVYARQEPNKKCRVIERYTRSFNYPEEASSGKEIAAKTNNGIKAIFCSDVCAMYNRRFYEEIGGFPEKAIFNEDEVFAAKALSAGYDVRYEPKAVVIHSHNYSGVEYFKRYFDLGVSHRDFAHIFDKYHADDEGIRLVKDTMKYLLQKQLYFEIPLLVYHSGAKFLGMKLGRHYKELPMEVVLKCTSNPNYWKKS